MKHARNTNKDKSILIPHGPRLYSLGYRWIYLKPNQHFSVRTCRSYLLVWQECRTGYQWRAMPHPRREADLRGIVTRLPVTCTSYTTLWLYTGSSKWYRVVSSIFGSHSILCLLCQWTFLWAFSSVVWVFTQPRTQPRSLFDFISKQNNNTILSKLNRHPLPHRICFSSQRGARISCRCMPRDKQGHYYNIPNTQTNARDLWSSIRT